MKTSFIIGQDFNSKYEDNLDLSKTMIEIQLEELGKNKSRYCLEIYCDDKYYYLNKFNDWKYNTLAAIVDEYKLKTGKSVAGMDLYSKLGNSKYEKRRITAVTPHCLIFLAGRFSSRKNSILVEKTRSA